MNLWERVQMRKSSPKSSCLIVSADFDPEPIISAKLLKELASVLAEKHCVTVIRPLPSRPYDFVIGSQVTEEYSYRHITLTSYVDPKFGPFGRLRERYSFCKATSRNISANYNEIKFITFEKLLRQL